MFSGMTSKILEINNKMFIWLSLEIVFYRYINNHCENKQFTKNDIEFVQDLVKLSTGYWHWPS